MTENFWNIKEFGQMHIELTNGCNAGCPMCVRFFNNSPLVRPDLQMSQITFDKFIKYFPPHIIQKCKLILFCGVHGDPGTAKDTYEICQYIDKVSPNTAVRMNTNGGMRNPDWWIKMGELFSKHTDKGNSHWSITFSIDGLEDTNHLYRRNVNWDKLISNVTAFIKGGGLAIWDYLIFKHNEHQILEAKELSEKIGFDVFVPKKALGVDNGRDKLKYLPVLTSSGELDYVIEAPNKPENRNLENPVGVEDFSYHKFDIEDYRRMKESKDVSYFQNQVNRVYEDRIAHEDTSYYDSCEIKCKSKTMMGDKEIFVDSLGRVMPCCYIGTHLNGTYSDTRTLQLHKHMNEYGWDHFSLDKYTLEEILDSGHLDRVFADRWGIASVKQGKMAYCADTCGQISAIDKIFTHCLDPRTESDKGRKYE